MTPADAQWLAAAGPAGWFGKLACLGDFSSRRLPPDLVRTCDDWLSRGLTHSRAQLGARWLDTYLTAPVWRFAWAPGVVNAQWWTGALMPSVDSVGRYFPLLVAKAGFTVPSSPRALAQLERWFEQVAAVMLGTLAPGMSVDVFDAGITGLRDWDDCGDDCGDDRGPMSLPSCQRVLARERFEFAAGLAMAEGLPRVAAGAWLGGLSGCSLWWPVHAEATHGSLSVSRGLPPPEHFVDLLNVTW